MKIRFVLAYLYIFSHFLINASKVPAQTNSWEEASAKLKGAIDIHVHTMPDSRPRLLDAFELARIAQRSDMRALLFKNHYTHTASHAYLVEPGHTRYRGLWWYSIE